MPYIGTCFRFYTQMRVPKKKKHLHIEFIVTSHNSVCMNLGAQMQSIYVKVASSNTSCSEAHAGVAGRLRASFTAPP